MLFNSYVFIFGFLLLTLIRFFGLTRFGLIKAAKIWLTASYWYKKSVMQKSCSDEATNIQGGSN